MSNRLVLSAVAVVLLASRGVSQDVEVMTKAMVDQSFVGGKVVLQVMKPDSLANVRYEGEVSSVRGKVAIVESPKMIVTGVRRVPILSKIPYVRSWSECTLEPTTEVMAGNLVLVSPTH